MENAVACEQIIAGRYALYGPIASGGMATVHFGRLLGSAGFQRTVAIKRLRGEFLDSPEFVSTLLDEARLASRIRHPNVVATLDMVASAGEVFLVMDYVSGESLSRLLASLHHQGERLDLPIATGILCGVLHGLQAAHEARDERGEPLGIVHRDVSPQNVLVGVDGLARLLDFGIAKGKGRLQTTRAGQLKGKVGYMAPEQILGEEPDRRTDVYAASVVLWEALTGRRLFGLFDDKRDDDAAEGDSYTLIPTILEAKVVPPSAIVPDIPAELDAIVMRGLHRRREQRFASARELAVALEERVGIATNRQIGDWVEQAARQALTKRAVLLAALERASTEPEEHRGVVDATMRTRHDKRLAEQKRVSSPDDARRDRAATVPEQDAVEDRMRDRSSTPREQDVVDDEAPLHDEPTAPLQSGEPNPFEDAPTELALTAPRDEEGPEPITEIYDKARHKSLPTAVRRPSQPESLPMRSNVWFLVIVLLAIAAVIVVVRLAG